MGSMAFTGYTEQQNNAQSGLICCKKKAAKKTVSYFTLSAVHQAGHLSASNISLAGLRLHHNRLANIHFKSNEFCALHFFVNTGFIQLKTIPLSTPEHPVI
jgi:hypothetical protein